MDVMCGGSRLGFVSFVKTFVFFVVKHAMH